MVLKRIQAWALLHTTAVVQYRGRLMDKRCCCDLTVVGKLEVKRKEWEAIPVPSLFFSGQVSCAMGCPSWAPAAHRVAGMYDWTGCVTFGEGLLRVSCVESDRGRQTWPAQAHLVNIVFSLLRNGLSFRCLFSSVRTNYKEDSPPPPTRNQKPVFWDPTLRSEILKASLASGKHQFLVIEPKISAQCSKAILRRRGSIYRITSFELKGM